VTAEEIKAKISTANDNELLCRAEARRLRWNASEMDQRADQYQQNADELLAQLNAARKAESLDALTAAPAGAVVVIADERDGGSVPSLKEEADARARALGFPDHESYAWDQIEKGRA